MQYCKTHKKQTGLTLVESLLVLAVAALVAVLAYGGYKMANQGVKSQSGIESSVRLLTAIKKTFGTTNDYTGIDATKVKQSGVVPSDFGGTATTITAPFGSGNMTIAVDGTDKTLVNVTFPSVPTDLCMDLLAGIEGLTTNLKVGGTDVKTATTPFSAVTAAPKCASAADVIATIK